VLTQDYRAGVVSRNPILPIPTDFLDFNNRDLFENFALALLNFLFYGDDIPSSTLYFNSHSPTKYLIYDP
jgi:hypothetical protein